MSHDEDPKSREDEPLEEADAIECDMPAPGCEFVAHERDGAAHEAEASLREEIFETFQPKNEVMVAHPDDGLPMPAEERSELAVAHPFTIEAIVCLEDDREYVELFDDELEERGWSFHDNVGWLPASDPRGTMAGRSHIRSLYDDDGTARVRLRFDPGEVKEMFGVKVALAKRSLVPVRPLRERCEHFKRQLMANDDVPDQEEPGHFIKFYNCTKRRSVGGAFMTLRDEAVYACDYRQPPDPETTEKWLDAPDRKRLHSQRHLKMVRPFNLSG